MENYDAVFSILAIACVFLIFYGPWQELCADFARQIIFEEREKLFDLAADGKMSFEGDDYKLIRTHLEKSIRFSHEMTVFRFAVYQSTMEHFGDGRKGSALRDTINAISDPATQKALENIVDRSSKALVLAMGARSAIALAMFGLSWPIRQVGLLAGLSGKIRKVQRAVQKEVEQAPA